LCPEAPPEQAAIDERALRTTRAERYPDAGAFAGELLAYMAGGRVEAYRYGPLELARKFARQNPALSVAIATSALILLVSGLAVAVQLRQAQVNLASTLSQRARRAEDVSDWARAAAYFAASRVENDTMAARWGIALARERLPERGSTQTGPPGAFTDVDVLPEGTVVALETRNGAARLYEVATGRSLWTAQMERPIQGARITSGAIRLLSGHVHHVLDERTGQERFTSDPDRETLCRNGPPNRRARIDHAGVLLLEGAEGPFTAAEHLARRARYAGDRVHRARGRARARGLAPALRRPGRRLFGRGSWPVRLRILLRARAAQRDGQRGRTPGGGRQPDHESR
jgi:hypothetical protein